MVRNACLRVPGVGCCAQVVEVDYVFPAKQVFSSDHEELVHCVHPVHFDL